MSLLFLSSDQVSYRQPRQQVSKPRQLMVVRLLPIPAWIAGSPALQSWLTLKHPSKTCLLISHLVSLWLHVLKQALSHHSHLLSPLCVLHRSIVVNLCATCSVSYDLSGVVRNIKGLSLAVCKSQRGTALFSKLQKQPVLTERLSAVQFRSAQSCKCRCGNRRAARRGVDRRA